VLAHIHLRLEGGDIGRGSVERAAVAFAVEDDQDVALVHELIVLDPHFVDEASNIGRDRDGVGLDPGIAGPWREYIIIPQLVSADAASSDEDQGEQNACGGFHRASSRSGKQNEAGEEADEEREPHQRWMPDQAVKA